VGCKVDAITSNDEGTVKGDSSLAIETGGVGTVSFSGSDGADESEDPEVLAEESGVGAREITDIETAEGRAMAEICPRLTCEGILLIRGRGAEDDVPETPSSGEGVLESFD
jgi:hypothetical protein